MHAETACISVETPMTTKIYGRGRSTGNNATTAMKESKTCLVNKEVTS